MLDVLSPGSNYRPQLRLINFVWDKENVVDSIEFSTGINLIGERNQVERTIILRLIRYAMGGSHKRIDEDIAKATKQVSLEFLANGRRVTTTRGFEHPTVYCSPKTGHKNVFQT